MTMCLKVGSSFSVTVLWCYPSFPSPLGSHRLPRNEGGQQGIACVGRRGCRDGDGAIGSGGIARVQRVQGLAGLGAGST
jgi:hypothetical protein